MSDHFRACNEQNSMKSGYFYWIYIAMTDVFIFARCHSLSISLIIDCYLDSQSGLYSKETVLKWTTEQCNVTIFGCNVTQAVSSLNFGLVLYFVCLFATADNIALISALFYCRLLVFSSFSCQWRQPSFVIGGIEVNESKSMTFLMSMTFWNISIHSYQRSLFLKYVC